MLRRTVLKGIAATAAGGFIARPPWPPTRRSKIGISMPMTGAGFAAVGRQLKAAIKLYMQQHGDTVAGRKIELTIRDDGGVADNARRIVQEMIVNDKVDIVGIGITPTALAIAPLVTEAKKATLVMSSGASITTTKSPYFVRAGFILSPQSWIMGEWAFKNGSKRVVTLVNDWAPGIEAETAFKTRLHRRSAARSSSRSAFRSPIPTSRRSCSASPISSRIRRSSISPAPRRRSSPSSSPSAGSASPASRSSGRAISPTDDESQRHGRSDARHDHRRRLFRRARFRAQQGLCRRPSEKANNFRPDFVSLGGYDGLHLIYEALKKTGGNTDGDALLAAMKGMAWESPRGPISIDPETRDIVSNIYIRKVEKIDGAALEHGVRDVREREGSDEGRGK